MMLNMLKAVAITLNCLLVTQTLCQAAAVPPAVPSSAGATSATSQVERVKPLFQHQGSAGPAASPAAEKIPLPHSSSGGSSSNSNNNNNSNNKLKRETSLSALEHLDTQETIDFHHLPAAPVHHSSYQAPASTSESDYGYDSGKNNYGKQASDWSLYDQGNHGIYDKYGDKAWKDHGHNAHAAHGKHDSYGNSYNSHGAGHGSGYYSRDRGYGYEKHYAYDKEVASKHHSDSHNNYGSQHGLHDHYGNSASNSHTNAGHDKYGQASRYGNHGYGKRGSNLAAHHDYGHNANKGHYYSSQAAPQSGNYHHSYSSHVPTYRSTYSDYGPQIGYPSSYPSYY